MDTDFPAFSHRCYGYGHEEEEGFILIIAEARIALKMVRAWLEHREDQEGVGIPEGSTCSFLVKRVV